MNMKSIFVFFALLAVISADQPSMELNQDGFNCEVDYTSADGQYYYYLADFPTQTVTYNWLSAVDEQGNTWRFNLCPDNVDPTLEGSMNIASCPQGSSVCVFNTVTGAISDRGQTATLLYSDSPLGENMGVEASFGTSDSDGNSYKTVIEYVCQQWSENATDPAISVQLVDATYTVITVNTSTACPESVMMDDPEWDDDDEDMDGFFFFPFFSFGFIIFFVVSFLMTCICCCCLVRRRKCQMRKAQAMKQFSNVAFQPIPQTQATFKAPTQQAPAFNPYLAQQQQQFVYYYPAQQAQQAPQLFTQPIQVQQEKSDEQLAKELQAQYDREASRV